MNWRIIRQTPARGDKPARDIAFASNIMDRGRAERIAAEYEALAADFDGAKFVVCEDIKTEKNENEPN